MRKTLGVTLQSPQALTCHPHVCKHAHTQEHMHEEEEGGGGEKERKKSKSTTSAWGLGPGEEGDISNVFMKTPKKKINETNVAPS